MNLQDYTEAAAKVGLSLTGCFHPTAEDAAPEGSRTLLLLGYGGASMWDAFNKAPEASDGSPHGIDRWSKRTVDQLANDWGGQAVYPFGGPPYQPFIRWTFKGEPLHQSRLGMAIHEQKGLWPGWRGAIGLPSAIDLPPVKRSTSPCAPCPAPCITACPVSAFSDAGYDTVTCRAHLNTDAGAECRKAGCLARRACPVGLDFAQSAEQAAFHLEAFRVA
ncbi:MAG: ferredoxin [Pikeienuella sp.]